MSILFIGRRSGLTSAEWQTHGRRTTGRPTPVSNRRTHMDDITARHGIARFGEDARRDIAIVLWRESSGKSLCWGTEYVVDRFGQQAKEIYKDQIDIIIEALTERARDVSAP